MTRNKPVVQIKNQILNALKHDEAEDGLYFQNFFALGEEDERQKVEGNEEDILDALNELIREGQVRIDESNEKIIFHLAR